MTETILSPMIQNAIAIIMGAIASGIGALVALMLSQRRDVKKLLCISEVFSQNINTLNPCVKKILSVAKFHNTAFREVIIEVEDMLDKRYDANSEAAMAVGGTR